MRPHQRLWLGPTQEIKPHAQSPDRFERADRITHPPFQFSSSVDNRTQDNGSTNVLTYTKPQTSAKMAFANNPALKTPTVLEQLLEEINFQRTKEMRQLLKDGITSKHNPINSLKKNHSRFWFRYASRNDLLDWSFCQTFSLPERIHYRLRWPIILRAKKACQGLT